MISLIDAHCDTLTKVYNEKADLYDNNYHISIKKLSEFESSVQFFAIYLYEKHLALPFKNTLKIIDFYYDQINKYYNYIDTVSYAADILDHRLENKISSVLCLEGGEALEGKVSNLETFFELGIRCIALTHNRKNELGDGVGVTDGSGLSNFGRQVVKKMNDLDMIIDISHLNGDGFWDVSKLSKKPFIASHSNCYSVCPHKRNLTDDQIRAIKDCGGIIGINLYSPLVSEDNPDIDKIILHIDHIINLIGENYIGLGCDFDGISSVAGDIKNISDLTKLYDKLKTIYDSKVADKIFSENFSSLLDRILPEKK